MPTEMDSSLLLARIKLAELRRQRNQLEAHYSGVEQRAARAPTPGQRLRVLQEGLQAARFAQRPLHPDAGNLDVLLLEDELGSVSPELLDAWTQRLAQELDRGRRRAEFADLFGRLLDEWVDPPAPPGTAPRDPQRESPDWSFLWTAPEASIDLNFFQELFDRHAHAFESIRSELQTFGEQRSRAAVSSDEVKALLGMLAGSPYRQGDLRRRAASIRNSDVEVAEYAGVLTIMLHHLEEWDWPAEGFPLRSLWVRNKWRPYLDEDMLTLLFLQLVGLRWGMKLRAQLQSRILGAYSGIFSATNDEGEEVDPLMPSRANQCLQFFMPMVPISLASLASGGGYGSGYGRSARTLETPTLLEELLATVNAEIQVRQAAAPGSPVTVVQTDLRDYYLRIPHAVLLLLTEQLGVPPVWQEFFRRYLSVRLQHEGETCPVMQGVLLDHLLGAVLADCLLLFLDLHVYESAGIRTLRLVDDIYCVTSSAESAVAAWEAIRRFCAAAGLEPNERKSGSVCLGGARVPGLPEGYPRWGLLRLQDDGAWQLDTDAFQQVRNWTRRQAEDEPSVLGMIVRYNSALQFVHRSLGLPVRLGFDHLERMGRAIAELHRELFGPGHGMVEEIRRRIGDRFPEQVTVTASLPEALFYWPITAGGLGLTAPLVPVAGFRKGLREQPTPAPQTAEPELPFEDDRDWMTPYYYTIRRALPLAAPDRTTVMSGLLEDFVARGSEVSGREQPDLSPTWQWVVYTYGPSLLETLGTFRFLLTELVPLQLILLNQMQASAFEEAHGPEIPR